jgi:Zn-dependent peptidase ImmA (M78 family)
MPVGTSDGKYFNDEWEAATSQFIDLSQQDKPLKQAPIATEKPTDALKSDEATLVTPVKQDQANIPKTFVDKLKETWPAKMAEGFLQALALPGDVYSGKVDLNTQEGQNKATEMALNLGVGGMATTGFKPGVGMFGGRMSPQAVQAATNLERAGLAPDKVKYYTGLERGAEGMWRKEISDVDSVFKAPSNLDRAESVSAPMRLVFDHPILYKDYPELQNVRVTFKSKESMNGNNGEYLSEFGPTREPAIFVNKDMSPEEMKKTILHESQHFIQDTEGFAIGSPKDIPPALADQVKGHYLRHSDELKNVVDLMEKGDIEGARTAAKDALEKANYSLYRGLSSEVEAFNVEARKDMTPQQIRKSLGRETETIPRANQTIPDQADVYAGSPY